MRGFTVHWQILYCLLFHIILTSQALCWGFLESLFKQIPLLEHLSSSLWMSLTNLKQCCHNGAVSSRHGTTDCHPSQTDFLWRPPGSAHSHGNGRNIMIQVYGNSNMVVNTPPTEKKRQQALLRCLSVRTLSLGHPPTSVYVILRVRVLDFRGTRRLPWDGDCRSASVMGYHSSWGASFLVIQFPLSHLFLKITYWSVNSFSKLTD